MSILVFLSLCVSLCLGAFPGTSQVGRLLPRTAPDPSDLSWIKAWASVGDSYSSGIGAGSKNGGWGDYFCSRYTASFPAIMNTDPRLGPASGRKFTYWPCSGATTSGVIKQVKALGGGSQDIITITSGGNDAYLSSILNECVYQWLSDADPFHSACPKQLAQSQAVIDSPSFHSLLDQLISTAKSKLKPGGHIYYVGYAQFWGEEDSQCNSVTWAFPYEFGKREYLSQAKRTQMNTLVVNMNTAISNAATRAGSGVTFIDYDLYYTQSGGRFCEDGYPETSPNRAGLLFYEWDTNDNAPPTSGLQAQNSTTPLSVTPALVMNGTFEGDINAWIKETLAKNSSWGGAWAVDNSPPSINSVNATEDQILIGYSTSWIPDGYGRVFHPRPNGHQLISNLILYNIEANYAAQLHQSWPPAVITSATCGTIAAQATSTQHSTTTPQTTATPHPTTPLQLQKLQCHNPANYIGHGDINEEGVELGVSQVCSTWLNTNLTSTSQPLVLTEQTNEINYEFIVSWIPGCKATQDSLSVYAPLGYGSPLYQTCDGILYDCWSNCTTNGGIGGAVDFGCLRYVFAGGLGSNSLLPG